MKNLIAINFIFGGVLLLTGCSQHHGRSNTTAEQHVVSETYIHKYGVTIPKNDWSERGKSGKVVSTLRNGVIVTKNYSNGYLEGETSYTFPHSGSIEKVETYSNGKMVKEQTHYSSGVPKQSVEHEDSNVRIITSWYEDGSPHLRERYENSLLMDADYYTANHQVESRIEKGTGKRQNRDEFGQLLSVDNIERGLIVTRTIFYPNGATKELIPYVNGKVNGQKRTFLPGGEPSTVESWANDKQEGDTIVFKNGEKIAVVPYLNGQKSGVEERYRDSHYIVEEVTWKNGNKSGPTYTHIGEDTHITWYHEGNEVSKLQYDQLTKPR